MGWTPDIDRCGVIMVVIALELVAVDTNDIIGTLCVITKQHNQ